MSRTLSLLIAMVAVMGLLAACTPETAEITEEDQVPADQVAEADDDGEPADDDGEAAATGDVVSLEALDSLEFDPDQLAVPAGNVTFELVNVGNLPHDFVIEELGDEVVIDDVDGGASATGSVDLEAGDYTYYCSIPGHRAGGMEGSLTVEG